MADEPEGEEVIDEGDTEELYQLAAAYDFESGHAYALTPTFAVDFVDDEEVYVYGVVLSRHF